MDKNRIPNLIQIGSSNDGLAKAQDIATKALREVDVVFPHNGCAATLSALLQLAEINIPMTLGAGSLATRLGATHNSRKWEHVPVGQQEAGDVGVTFDNTLPPGSDHIYLVVRRIDDDEMVIADNQDSVPHRRFASGRGKTPTDYFLRATADAPQILASPILPLPLFPQPDDLALDCSIFKNQPVLEAIANGHAVLVATGRLVAGAEYIQDALNFLSKRNSDYGIDLGAQKQYRGYFGEHTETAIVAFQKDHDLKKSGRVDRATIHALDYAVAAEELSNRDIDPDSRPTSTTKQVVDVLRERVYTENGPIIKNVNIYALPGKSGYFYLAKMSIDADGAPKCYHPTDDRLALDGLENATSNSKRYVQGANGVGPAPGFYVSQTSLNIGPANNCGSFVDATTIPFVVFPDNWKDVALGDCGIIYNTRNGKLTHVIFADTNPKVGEASVKTAANLGLSKAEQSPKNGGIDDDIFIYLLFPGTRFTPAVDSPHWSDAKIQEVAQDAFQKWGGLAQLKACFPRIA